MIHMALTKKLADYLNKKSLPVYENPFPSIHSWHANLITMDRHKHLLFMHDISRYSLILYRIKKKDCTELEALFHEYVAKNLLSDGFSHGQIMALLAIEEFRYVKFHDRSVQGSMNDHKRALTFYEAGFGGMGGVIHREEGIYQQELNRKLNDTPMMCSKEGFYPVDKLNELI